MAPTRVDTARRGFRGRSQRTELRAGGRSRRPPPGPSAKPPDPATQRRVPLAVALGRQCLRADPDRRTVMRHLLATPHWRVKALASATRRCLSHRCLPPLSRLGKRIQSSPWAVAHGYLLPPLSRRRVGQFANSGKPPWAWHGSSDRLN